MGKRLYKVETVAKLEELEDMWLLKLAGERIGNISGKLYTQEEVMASLGITQEELDAMEDVEIE